MKNDTIKAVHDDDIDELLESLGLFGDLNQGKLTCHYCGNAITKENLSSIFPLNDKVEFCCDKPDCIAVLFSEDQSI